MDEEVASLNEKCFHYYELQGINLLCG